MKVHGSITYLRQKKYEKWVLLSLLPNFLFVSFYRYNQNIYELACGVESMSSKWWSMS